MATPAITDLERVSIRWTDSGSSLRCTITVTDPSLRGHSAELRVVRRVVVHDSRPVNASDTVWRTAIDSLAPQNDLEVSRDELRMFSYRGSEIDIEIHTELEIDDGFLFDTTIRREEEIAAGLKPSVANDAKEIVEPHDAFDFLTNFQAIPPKNRMITTVLLIFAAVIVSVNTWVGVHDQFVPEPMTWFYDHRDSDGDSESPLYKSLMASGALGAMVWLAIRRQLRTYMTFQVLGVPGRIGRSDEIDVRAILRGRSRVPLHDVIVRIVACNIEKGQYKRGTGTKERTVSFSEPSRAVILYDCRVGLIPAGMPVERCLEGIIRFEPMFRSLYPPQVVSSSHGIAVHWEVQLIHDELVDQEVICDSECFEWNDFLTA